MEFENFVARWKSVAQWKKDRQKMQGQVEWLESGNVKSGTGQVNTTADDIAYYKRKIAELDVLIARHDDK